MDLITGEYIDIENEMNYGIDLCEKFDGKTVEYLVSPSISNINDSDIIIINPIKVGNFLRFLGFSEYLTKKDLNYAKKILLDSSYPIKTIKSSTSLDDLGKIDLLEIKETIEQLKNLKSDGNLSNITKVEKEISKSYLIKK